MMIILEASAEGRRYRQPLANIHGVVVVIVIATVSKFPGVRPVVLNHIYPQRKNSYSQPHHQRKLEISSQFPQEPKAKGLRKDCKNRMRKHQEGPGLQDFVAGHIFFALIRHQAEIERSPKTIPGKFIGIPGMVGMFMMQAMAVYPGD